MSGNYQTALTATPETEQYIHVYFAKTLPSEAEELALQAVQMAFSTEIVYCTDWRQLIKLLKLNPRSVCVSADHFEGQMLVEVISMIETFSKLVGNERDITITMGINRDTPHSRIKEAQKSRIMGIVPSHADFGAEETARAVTAQWSTIPYWPKTIIEQLPGAKKTIKSTCAIKLTNRQQQIFDLVVSRGCSNKHIAKILELSESTVKLHMSAVFKKYGVKNRTQLAVFSKSPN